MQSNRRSSAAMVSGKYLLREVKGRLTERVLTYSSLPNFRCGLFARWNEDIARYPNVVDPRLLRIRKTVWQEKAPVTIGCRGLEKPSTCSRTIRTEIIYRVNINFLVAENESALRR